MVDPGERLVCDLTFISRLRLLCGLYNGRTVPKHLQGFARTYCLVVCLAFMYYICSREEMNTFTLIYVTISFVQYLIASCSSFWTGDEYVYKFFTQNKTTDVTLDSPLVFKHFQIKLKKMLIFAALLCSFSWVLTIVAWFRFISFISFLFFFCPPLILDLVAACSYSTKFLVLGLFNSRILILRRRLERYGFRTIGGAPPQPYCKIYDEIWEGLDATNNPLKVLLLLDLVISCSKIIITLLILFGQIRWKDSDGKIWGQVLCAVTEFTHVLFAFGHVAFLESAASHCEHMAVFTATQLIKTPTPEERQRMYNFLRALEQRGARYRVVRALPINAQLVLGALGFCSSQALVLFSMLKRADVLYE